MKFFEELEFPPPDLCPKSRKFAARSEKITKSFIKQAKRLDRKMWIQVCKYMVNRSNYDCPENNTLDRALDGIMESFESRTSHYHIMIRALGEMLDMDTLIFPLNVLDEDIKAELVDIAQVSYEYYRSLEDLHGFMTMDD